MPSTLILRWSLVFQGFLLRFKRPHPSQPSFQCRPEVSNYTMKSRCMIHNGMTPMIRKLGSQKFLLIVLPLGTISGLSGFEVGRSTSAQRVWFVVCFWGGVWGCFSMNSTRIVRMRYHHTIIYSILILAASRYRWNCRLGESAYGRRGDYEALIILASDVTELRFEP